MVSWVSLLVVVEGVALVKRVGISFPPGLGGAVEEGDVVLRSAFSSLLVGRGVVNVGVRMGVAGSGGFLFLFGGAFVLPSVRAV